MSNRIESKSEATNAPEVLLSKERLAWRSVLGVEVEIAPLPSIVTPEVRKNLEHMGLELCFIPKVNIGTIDNLKRMGEEKYLSKLQKRYPGWRRYESLSETEQDNHSVGRNLEEWYWKRVKNGNIDFPRLPGVWMAVETIPKPSYGDTYKKTAITDKLGLSDRFYVTWNKAQTAIQKAKLEILSEAGLPNSLEVRMLETLEWNLLANCEGWGATDTHEWTNTEYREDGESGRVLVGDSDGGGAADISWDPPGRAIGSIGFRLVVVLGS